MASGCPSTAVLAGSVRGAGGGRFGFVLRSLAYSWYARRLRSRLAGQPVPRHVALIMDGNRRWARQMGMANPSLGHKHGAEHVEDVLRWCEAAGIRHVTVFVCSTENLLRRDDAGFPGDRFPARAPELRRPPEQALALTGQVAWLGWPPAGPPGSRLPGRQLAVVSPRPPAAGVAY
jgi:hypothetical protein